MCYRTYFYFLAMCLSKQAFVIGPILPGIELIIHLIMLS